MAPQTLRASQVSSHSARQCGTRAGTASQCIVNSYGDSHQHGDSLGRWPYASTVIAAHRCCVPLPGIRSVFTYVFRAVDPVGSPYKASSTRTYADPENITKFAVEARSASTICPSTWFALRLQHSTRPRTKPLQYPSQESIGVSFSDRLHARI